MRPLNCDPATQKYRYPNLQSIGAVREILIPDPINGGTITRKYFEKGAHGDTGYLLSATDYLYVYKKDLVNDEDFDKLPVLDDNVYASYAQKLIPRAVSYSAALLQYFFRGKIDLESNNGYVIKNNGNEELSGNFYLLYDDVNNNRYLLESWEGLTIPANSQAAATTATKTNKYAYINPKEFGKFMLVFRGQMGGESGAVAGAQVSLNFWSEDWNNDLKGNHNWAYTGVDLPGQNTPGVGEIANVTAVDVQTGETTLVMENIRYGSQSENVQINESFLSADHLPFNDVLPMPLTADSAISLKIDEISLIPEIPYQDCVTNQDSDVGWLGSAGEQGVMLRFKDAKNQGISMAFTVHGQEPSCYPGYGIDHCIWYYLTPGVEFRTNTFAELNRFKIPFTEPVSLVLIENLQQFRPLCTNDYPTQQQKMVIDYLRIID
ncbi:MAG: hypothetical protein HGA96_11300 [Desulfobulbaceae bacterium]|nr:hypothetical protein [Desulfobulbaceae bacterium]